MEDFKLWGSIVNAFAVMAGSSVGLILHHVLGASGRGTGGRMSGFSDAIMKGLGLCVLLIGIQGALNTQNVLMMILSVVIGAMIGHLCDLDGMINRLGQWIERKTKGRFGPVAEGFVSATLLFCVGAMTVVGSLNSGLNGDHTMQYTKSMLDLTTSVIFASSMGIGVMFAAVSVLVIQGGITLLATWIAPILTETVITEMTAVGSLLIIGLAFNMLGLTKLKIMNYLPAIFLPILFCLLM